MKYLQPTNIIVLSLFASCCVAACSSGGPGTSGSGGSSASGQSSSGEAGASSSSSGQGGDGGLLIFDGGPGSGGGGNTGTALIYASTDTTLYQLDPTSPSLPLTEIGLFDCIGTGTNQYKAMTDIAVDRNDNLWGITGHVIMPLTIQQGGVVACGKTTNLVNGTPGQTLPTFYALTFAPAGVIEPNSEVLMAADSVGNLWAIDSAGQTTQHGNFGMVPTDDGNGYTYNAANVGQPWEISGDLVFLANNGSPVGFATVRDCPNPPSTTGCNKTDTLLEIDMTKLATPGTNVVAKAVRGAILKAQGCTDTTTAYGSMYGIAAWNDQVYGFSRTGLLVAINTNKGGTCLVQDYPMLNFSGAGVTTLAPVLPPPPK